VPGKCFDVWERLKNFGPGGGDNCPGIFLGVHGTIYISFRMPGDA